MDIIKIGGSKINSPELFFRLINYIIDYSTTNNKSAFFIISAFNKNTKDLKKCLELSIDKSINNYFSLEKKETKQKKKVQQILNQIFEFHFNLFNHIVLLNEQLLLESYKDKNLEKKIKSHIRNFELSLEVFLNEINEILQNVSYLNYYSAKTLDKVISYGEICALNTINYSIELYNILTTNNLLKSNHNKLNENIKFINALDFVTTDDNYSNAKINEKATNKKLNKILTKLGYNHLKSKNLLNNQQFTFITQGFIAKSENGEITTMGMESSNFTAAIICKFFNSKKLNIITDTNGIYDSDPRVFTKYNTINNLDYKTAYNLSTLGLKLLHKQMLLVCSENDIEITYSSIFDLNKTNQITTIIHKQNNNNSINIEPIFIVNFNFYRYSFNFNNLTDFNNYIPNNSLEQINFYKKDKINLTISYFTDESNNSIAHEEVILLTIYNFSKINNDFFEDKLLKDLIEFIEIDYKNNITFLIINKVKKESNKNDLINNNQDEAFIFDRIKSYFI